jgi:hypothetical protein
MTDATNGLTWHRIRGTHPGVPNLFGGFSGQCLSRLPRPSWWLSWTRRWQNRGTMEIVVALMGLALAVAVAVYIAAPFTARL